MKYSSSETISLRCRVFLSRGSLVSDRVRLQSCCQQYADKLEKDHPWAVRNFLCERILHLQLNEKLKSRPRNGKEPNCWVPPSRHLPCARQTNRVTSRIFHTGVFGQGRKERTHRHTTKRPPPVVLSRARDHWLGARRSSCFSLIEGTEGHTHKPRAQIRGEREREERSKFSQVCHFTEMTSIEQQALVRDTPAPGRARPLASRRLRRCPRPSVHHARTLGRLFGCCPCARRLACVIFLAVIVQRF